MYKLYKKLGKHKELESTHVCKNINALNVLKQCSGNIVIKKHQIDQSRDKILSTFKTELNDESDKNNVHEYDKYIEIKTENKNKYDKRPLIKIKIYGDEYQALLDTGASISVFGTGTELLWQKSSEIISTHKVDIKLPNGVIVGQQAIKSIPIEFDAVTKEVKIAYSPAVLCPIIMGANFLHSFDLKICKLTKFEDVPDENAECFAINSSDEESIDIPDHLKRKLDKSINLFPFDDDGKLGCQEILRHRIDTGDNEPIIQHQYSYNMKVLEKIHVVIDDWLAQGVIEKSKSAWRNPVVVVKKSDGNVRLCLDARKLNSITKRDRLLTPNVFEALSSIPSDVKIFGRLDKNQAFLQTKLADEDKEKTAFFIKGRGLFHFLRMPFGLANAPATQTRLMLEIFGELEPYVLVYFDDIIVMGKDYDHYVNLLRKVAMKLKTFNLTISRDKMNLSLKNIKILGHIVSPEGINADPAKTDAINKWPIPSTKKELQRFIGMCNWYRRHIKDFSAIASPMTELLKAKKFTWNESAGIAFKKLKEVLLSPPILRPPRWDLTMILQCDASNEGVGAALTQIDENGEEFVIEYFSAKLTDNERKFSPTEKECLAVIKAIKHFRPYIELMELKILTDHYSLKYLLNMTVTAGRLARWILFLQPYVNCIQHRSGRLMKVADALSRAPIMNSEEENGNIFTMEVNAREFNLLFNKIKTNPERIPNYCIQGNRLLCKTNFDNEWKVVPEPRFRDEIIQASHEETVHGGIKSTLAKTREKWTWKNMKRDIRKWVLNCFKCASIKAPNKKLSGQMLNTRIPKRCMEILSIDIKGPFPPAGIQRFKYIVVLIDLLSRYAWIKLHNKVTSVKIIRFLQEIFDDLERPRMLIHDNGNQFTSHEFKRYIRDNGIESAYTPIYCAKNNPVERFNRTLGESLSLYLLDFPMNHTVWHKYVDDIVLKLNNRVNEATGFKPATVLYGINPKIENNKAIRSLDDTHKKLMNQAYVNSIRKFEWNQTAYNRSRTNRIINDGDVVMVTVHKISNASKKFNKKLAENYQPAIVMNKVFSNAYRIMLQNGREVIADVSNLKEVASELQEVIKHRIFNRI